MRLRCSDDAAHDVLPPAPTTARASSRNDVRAACSATPSPKQSRFRVAPWPPFVGPAASRGSHTHFADVSLSYLWAQLSYRAKSLWPAVFLHSFHNGVSQWLFAKFFAGGDETWLGEGGVLPLSCYVIAGRPVYQSSSGGTAVVDSGRDASYRSRVNPRLYLAGDGGVAPFQSSTFRLGTRWNSVVLCVTSVSLRALACPAMSTS
jgi:hypothetical protein